MHDMLDRAVVGEKANRAKRLDVIPELSYTRMQGGGASGEFVHPAVRCNPPILTPFQMISLLSVLH